MVHHLPSTACRKYGDMLPQSTRSAQRSFWKLIDEAPETRLALLDVGVDEQTDVTAGQLQIGQQLSHMDWLLTHPLHLCGLCGEYVTALPARSTSRRGQITQGKPLLPPKSTRCAARAPRPRRQPLCSGKLELERRAARAEATIEPLEQREFLQRSLGRKR